MQRSVTAVKRGNKFGARKTYIDGIWFASRAESRRYLELKLLESRGEIKELELQPRYELHAGMYAQKVGAYLGDFRYLRKGEKGKWERIVEDVKGGRATETALWRWKTKHLAIEHGVVVQVVRNR